MQVIRAQRFAKQDGPARDLPAATHLERWEAMLAGSEYGRRCVLRARISMQHENSALRDPALARCVDVPHQRTGAAFRCYPTYDLAIAVCDDLEVGRPPLARTCVAIRLPACDGSLSRPLLTLPCCRA